MSSTAAMCLRGSGRSRTRIRARPARVQLGPAGTRAHAPRATARDRQRRRAGAQRGTRTCPRAAPRSRRARPEAVAASKCVGRAPAASRGQRSGPRSTTVAPARRTRESDAPARGSSIPARAPTRVNCASGATGTARPAKGRASREADGDGRRGPTRGVQRRRRAGAAPWNPDATRARFFDSRRPSRSRAPSDDPACIARVGATAAAKPAPRSCRQAAWRLQVRFSGRSLASAGHYGASRTTSTWRGFTPVTTCLPPPGHQTSSVSAPCPLGTPKCTPKWPEDE